MLPRQVNWFAIAGVLIGAAVACVGGFVVSAFVAPMMMKNTRSFVTLYFGSFRTLMNYIKNAINNRSAGK